MTAAIIYLGEILATSLPAVALLAISNSRMSGGTALFIGGVVGWTLAEYLVHRFVLHRLVPSQHGQYHANPDETVRTIFWQIWACFAVAYLIAGGAFVAGALIAYAWYLFVHHGDPILVRPRGLELTVQDVRWHGRDLPIIVVLRQTTLAL